MPTFSMPMMMASFPVMPTTVSRAAEPPASDCCERMNKLEAKVDNLEANLLSLTTAMRDLQLIVKDQTSAIEKIVEKAE